MWLNCNPETPNQSNMSLANLTVAELQNLLMEETKRLTTALREGHTVEKKEEIKNKIEQVIKILKEKNSKNRLADH